MGSLTRVLALATVVAPAHAHAEGGAVELRCSVTFTCTEKAVCDHVAVRQIFRLEPVRVGPAGDGTFRISHDGISAEATNVTPTGPLIWTEPGNGQQILSSLGPATMLWQRRDAAKASVLFLDCDERS